MTGLAQTGHEETIEDASGNGRSSAIAVTRRIRNWMLADDRLPLPCPAPILSTQGDIQLVRKLTLGF